MDQDDYNYDEKIPPGSEIKENNPLSSSLKVPSATTTSSSVSTPSQKTTQPSSSFKATTANVNASSSSTNISPSQKQHAKNIENVSPSPSSSKHHYIPPPTSYRPLMAAPIMGTPGRPQPQLPISAVGQPMLNVQRPRPLPPSLLTAIAAQQQQYIPLGKKAVSTATGPASSSMFSQHQPQQQLQPQPQPQPLGTSEPVSGIKPGAFYSAMPPSSLPTSSPSSSTSFMQPSTAPVASTATTGMTPTTGTIPSIQAPSPKSVSSTPLPASSYDTTQQTQPPPQQQTVNIAGPLPSSIPPHLSQQISEKAKLSELEEDKNLLELLNALQTFVPILPDELTEFYMMKAGLDTSDVKIKRLLALLTQKYITDIAQDALQYCRIRNVGPSGTSAGVASSGSSSKDKKALKEKKLVLNMEDLASALTDYGIHLKKPPYYR